MALPTTSERDALVVEALPVLSDNYVMLLSRGRQAVVVDPAVAEPVAAVLEQRQLELVAVLQTHHHHDHIGGTPELLQRWPACRVIAARSDLARIPFQTEGVGDGDRFNLLDEPVTVLAVPGHTRDHLAFHLPLSGHLFCGDTLFVAGCGRLFEGTPLQMWQSLQRLAQLPETTRLWCAHEYSAANLRWASALVMAQDPAAAAIAARLETVLQLRERGLPSIPSSVALERATNLFVRASDADELARLRSHKDGWRG